MKKWMKSKLLTIITVIVVAGVGTGSLLNASKLESLFNPGKFKKFENRYHSDNYDYAAGDGDDMNLADEDKEGKGKDEQQQEVLQVSEPEKKKGENDLGIATSSKNSSKSNKKNGVEFTNSNSNSSKNNSQNGTNATGGRRSGNVDNSGQQNPQNPSGNNDNNGTGDNNSDSNNKNDGNNSDGSNGNNGNDNNSSDNTSDSNKDNTGGNKSDDNTSSDNGNTGKDDDSKTSWEDEQLKPKDLVETADGKVAYITVTMKKSNYTKGESFCAEDAEVVANLIKDGTRKNKTLSYGGSDGYSVTLSTRVTGDQTAVFSYKGTTARAGYTVLGNYVNIYYAAAYGNTNDWYISTYPGVPLGNIDKDSYAALKKAIEFPNNTVINGNIFDLADIHKKMIAHLGDSSIKEAFGAYSGENYATTVFLSEDSEGYLTTMLEGFRYIYNKTLRDSRSYIYYPYDESWNTSGRAVVNVITAVPSGYKIRRVPHNEGNLEKYMADQVLEGYTGSDTTLTVPMGVTKIALTAQAAQVTQLSIPQSVSAIDTKTIAENLPNLTDYVAADSEKELALAGYKIIDGVLYSADGKTLLSVPAGKTKVTVPETVTNLAKDCFRGMSKDAVVTFNSQKAPTVEGETGYTGTIQVPISDYNTVYKRYMFAFGKEANAMTFSDTESQKDLYVYKEADKTLRYKEKESRLAAIAPETSGEYTVSEDVTSIGSGAFIDCKRLTDIIMGTQVTKLCESSLVLQNRMETVTLKAKKTDIADKLFGDTANGCEVPDITVYVDAAVYEAYLESWTKVLDPVYGENTAKTLLYGESLSYLYEDGAKYQKLTSGSKEAYRLVAVYQKSKTALRVKEGTVSVSAKALAECTALEIVSLPDTLTEIPEGLFTECTALETVLCDSSKTGIGTASGITDSADIYFAGKEYASFEYEDGIIYGKNTAGERTLLNVPTDYAGEVAIKDKTVAYGEEAFKDCHSITLFSESDDHGALKEIGARCFENCDFLAFIDLRQNTSLTKIGEEAFKECHQLKLVYLPESIETISRQMFYNDDALDAIGVENVTKIEDEAFYGCDALQNAPVDKAESIGDYAFYGCRMLQSLILPETLTSIGESCFENCTLLKTVEINADIPGIPRYCFYGCRGLTKVSFDSSAKSAKNSMKVIGVYAFSQCPTLEKMDLSDFHNLSQIGEGAFSCDGSLLNVKLPDSLRKIHKDSFEKCNSLSILQLNSESVTQLGEYIFGEELPEYLNIWVKDSVLSDYVTAYKEVLDPEYGEGTAENLLGVVDDSVEVIKGVTFEITDEGRILKHASKNLSGNYTVPEDTIAIADEAFMDCTKLTGIRLPRDASIRLGDRCFKNCTGLLKIEIYSQIPEWGEETFMNCTSATQLLIGINSTDPGIERIGTRAFKGCTDLSAVGAVQIVVSVRVLGEECFADCENITSPGISANFRNDLEVIEDGAFRNCKSLTAFLTSSYKGLKTIGAYAFENCDTLEKPTVPVNVTSIGEGCFMNCDSLQFVSFYPALSEYPKDCFKNCPKLIRTGGTAAAFNGLKRIGEGAYEGCVSLGSPTSSWALEKYTNLESIGANAFKGCSQLAGSKLAASLSSVGDNAFDGCVGMSTLTFNGTKPPTIGSFPLSSMADSFAIRVPDSKNSEDSVYKAYLEVLTKLWGVDKAYAVLDSLSDGAKDRYKEEMDKANQPDPASETTTEKKSETDASTEKKSEESSTEKTTEKDGEKTTESTEKSGESSEKSEESSSSTEKTEETSSEKKETTEKSEDTSTSTEKSSETSKSTETTDKKTGESSASKEKTSTEKGKEE